MWKVTIKGLLAHKLRFVLTGIAIILGIAFLSGGQSDEAATEQLRAYLASAALSRPEDVAPLVAWLCSPATKGVTGQIFGARGLAVSLWSQPRPVAHVTGWDDASRDTLEPSFVPLESEFDLL